MKLALIVGVLLIVANALGIAVGYILGKNMRSKKEDEE